MPKMIEQDEEFSQLIGAIERSTRTTKTVYSNGFLEVILAFGIVLILIPVSIFVLKVSMQILREPAKCSLLPATRYATELGRISDG